ncbi:MAG: VOC family protein [Saprospiraceae bacterium]|jgi:predicted lactoylglutathione lyase|nr:VOC family protein [Lewinellaceae bacterium]
MALKIFVNLAVKDLEKSKDFYTKIGYSINPQFTDHTAACVVLSEDIYVMLLTEKKFQEFSSKKLINAHESVEVLNALALESIAQVNDMVGKAVQAGGNEKREPMDLGFMYQRSFDDPDGHTWEVFWMNPEAVVEPGE